MYDTVLRMFWFAVMGGLVAWVVIPFILSRMGSLGRTEPSQFHHTHTGATSRLGGLALAASFVVTSLLSLLVMRNQALETRRCLVLAGGALAMFGLGFWDDLKPLGAKRKLGGQILIALAVWYGGIQIATFKNPFGHTVHSLGSAGCVLTVLWLVTFPNLINLIDGIDGLAGGITLMLMALLCYVAPASNVTFPAYCAAGMAGALLAFLRFNFPPAKIYMGDGGAYFLGFLIAGLSIINSHKGTLAAALVAPLFVLGLPLLDVTLAILRRGVKGFPVFRPDRRHIHHKLLGIGYTPRRAVLTLYGVSLFFLLLALAAFWSQGRLTPLLFGFACIVLILASRSFSFSREWLAVGKLFGNSIRMREAIQYALTLGQWLQMEARQCDSLDNLWSDFKFLVMKLNFSRVTLSSLTGDRIWDSTGSPSDLTQCHYRGFQIGRHRAVVLEFWMAADCIDFHLFEHLCEIAADAWQKSSDLCPPAGKGQGTVETEISTGQSRLSNPIRAYVPLAWDNSRLIDPGENPIMDKVA
jgi:UDP-GlcNAc:undecaprenyl-phosphate GlcNAc-1-phosphate transferase